MLENMLGEFTSEPGPLSIIGGDYTSGFYGEVPVGDFITGSSLNSMLGTGGSVWYPNEPWLKFSIDGKTVFYAKKLFKTMISWTTLHSLNLISGTKHITIKGRVYSVSVPRSLGPSGAWMSSNSEWDRLMYPISSNSPATTKWSNYSTLDLGLDAGYTWCKEISPYRATDRLIRGINTINSYSAADPQFAYSNVGWRPRLELVQ